MPTIYHEFNFKNPGDWNTNTSVVPNDIFKVSKADADNTSIYKEGDCYAARFEGPIGNRFYPAHGESNADWLYITPDIIKDIKYEKVQNNNRHEHHFTLTDKDYRTLLLFAAKSVETVGISVLSVLNSAYPETFSLLPVAITGGVIIGIEVAVVAVSHLPTPNGITIKFPDVFTSKPTVEVN
jgi:hypothetical protein